MISRRGLGVSVAVWKLRIVSFFSTLETAKTKTKSVMIQLSSMLPLCYVMPNFSWKICVVTSQLRLSLCMVEISPMPRSLINSVSNGFSLYIQAAALDPQLQNAQASAFTSRENVNTRSEVVRMDWIKKNNK